MWISGICKWCEQIIIVDKQPQFAAHVAQCHPEFEERSQKASLRLKGVILVDRIKEIRECPKCSSTFEVFGSVKSLASKKSKQFCSRKCANSKDMTDERRAAISNGVKNSDIAKIARSKINHGNRKKRISTPCLHCSQPIITTPKAVKKYHQECWQKISGGIRKGSSRGKSGWYKGYWCDSSWELAFVVYNLENDIIFQRNKMGFDYVFDNKNRKYYPDFLYSDGRYVEIKSVMTDEVDRLSLIK